MVKVRPQEKYFFPIKFLRMFLHFIGPLFLQMFRSQWSRSQAIKPCIWLWLQKQGGNQCENPVSHHCTHYLCTFPSSAEVVCEQFRHRIMVLWPHDCSSQWYHTIDQMVPRPQLERTIIFQIHLSHERGLCYLFNPLTLLFKKIHLA